MYAIFIDSRSIGGWYVAANKETAQAMVDTARATVPAAYRHLHRVGGHAETTKQEVEWRLGGGTGTQFKRHPIHADPSLELTPADTSRGTGGWDFTNVEGL